MTGVKDKLTSFTNEQEISIKQLLIQEIKTNKNLLQFIVGLCILSFYIATKPLEDIMKNYLYILSIISFLMPFWASLGAHW